ncbi:hypothetical protein CVU37_14205 [candidate division BRC1 bacterium HGW-BRC1-1]|nr:MAG: hypothetical protein CVU37_14205 [candidate division BRC1 bacterium HGW-BRC1-1]
MSESPTTNEPLPRSRNRWALLLIVVAFAFYIPLQIILPLRGLHGNDFKHIYLGMQALTEASEPYSPQAILLQASLHGFRPGDNFNPYVYLPFTGLAMAFLKPFTFPVASLVWFALNHIFTLAAAWFMATGLFVSPDEKQRWRSLLFGALVLVLALNFPLFRTLTAGQLNCVLLLCLAAAFNTFMRQRDLTAGAILGFAAMYKLAPGLYLLHLALRRRWRALVSMFATCATLGVISIAAVGWSIHLDFLPMLKQMSYGHSTWEEHNAVFWKEPANQSINALATHLLVSGNGFTNPWLELEQRHANAVTKVITFALIAAYIAAVWPCRRADITPQPDSRREAALFHTVLLLALLIPSLMWDHYMLLVLLPVAWLFVDSLRQHCHLRATIILLLFAATAIPWPFAAPENTSGARILLMSMKLLPTLGLYALCLLAAKPHRIAPQKRCHHAAPPAE